MIINEYGAVILSPEELFEHVYSDKIKNFKNIYLDQNTIDQFNTSKDINKDNFDLLSTYIQPDISVEQFDSNLQKDWFMPEDYCPNLIEMLYGMCDNQEQTNRVSEELELFIQHGMLDLLYYLKYLVDTMRDNKVVWGVGRGSSVASYVLYLIGIHKIDSLKYKLDIKEFLK
jgi:DNA polymerase III alpha subunit